MFKEDYQPLTSFKDLRDDPFAIGEEKELRSPGLLKLGSLSPLMRNQ